MKRLALVLLVLLPACSGPQTDSQICYAVADTDFWRVVETCKQRGLTYEGCPELVEAEARLRDHYGRCP